MEGSTASSFPQEVIKKIANKRIDLNNKEVLKVLVFIN